MPKVNLIKSNKQEHRFNSKVSQNGMSSQDFEDGYDSANIKILNR